MLKISILVEVMEVIYVVVSHNVIFIVCEILRMDLIYRRTKLLVGSDKILAK